MKLQSVKHTSFPGLGFSRFSYSIAWNIVMRSPDPRRLRLLEVTTCIKLVRIRTAFPGKSHSVTQERDVFPLKPLESKNLWRGEADRGKTCTHSWTWVRGFWSNGGIPRPPSTCDLSRPLFSIVGHLPYRNAQHIRFVILLGLRTKTKCFEGRACRTKCATGSTYKKRFWYGTVREFGETEELVQYVYT